MLQRSSQRFATSLLIWDVMLTLVCLHSTVYIRQYVDMGKAIPWPHTNLPWQLYVAVAVIWIIAFFLFNPQHAIVTNGVLEANGRLIASVGLAALAFAGLLYLSFRQVSRLQFLYFILLNLVVLLICHLLVRWYVQIKHRHEWQRRVLIVGDGTVSTQLADEFARRSWAGLTVVGFASNTPLSDSPFPYLGRVEETLDLILAHRIDEVVFALPPAQQPWVAQVCMELQQRPVMVHMVPDILDLAFARTPMNNLGGIPLISLRESALSESQLMLKRLFDMVASITLLVLLAPLMLVIAWLIKRESPGPVFFRQERIGEHGQRFAMMKFRSMYQDAEQRWQDVARRDASGKLLHKQQQDPRVTRIGQFIRRTSLDELPQLLNVLRGEMSLVGPRPEMPYVTAEYEPWQWQRFRVPPGITGWWQINGRSDKPMHLHTEDDLYYIQNYSFWLDLHILFRTIAVVLRGTGAY
ncbi:MAG: sugar transferase [Chloroflexaceae bacterium]|nr:sugar transferase [Chloroflexaceae bacterium]